MKILSWVLKGMGMGAANVIPGVSGGTIALITGIFERLINAIKSMDLKAAKLLFQFKFKEFAKAIDFTFLASIIFGIALAIISLAKLFDYLFTNYPIYIWAYFFGLVLASVYFVGKRISQWKLSVILSFIIGSGIAIFITMLHPATENDGFLYLILCGVVAIVSMILPGLSGSFILILMGNYRLVAIEAINSFNLSVLIPVGIGAGVGLIAFSHVLSWLFKKYADQTLAILTGFILGSLSVLWPWQKQFYLQEKGEFILKHGEKIPTYTENYLPANFDLSVIIAIGFILIGIISIYAVETLAKDEESESSSSV